MTAYVLRRLLLMIPTLLGITLVCFTLVQFVPGGPVEQAISKMRGAASARGSSARSISEAEIANIKAYYGFDQPAPVRYLRWLGNLFRLDLGKSYAYQRPVWDVIVSKMPVSLFFGLTSFFLSYLVSVPLGVTKAIRHGSGFDTASSLVIFAGYVMPSYALGVLLIVLFGGGTFLDWFPISGMVSDNFESLPTGRKIIDVLHHMILPLICYMAGEFAFLTMLMKNTLLEEINRDYVRTALAKGMTYRRAVWRHGLRNALIPLATGAGEILTVMFAGALLIERVFDLDGMGLLFFNSIVDRDYNVVLGLIFLTSMLTVLGRLLADLLYVVVDPRIRLH
ncbi:MAG: ABC transporter permease subunit [Verrucomicrobiota bacterium]|nr:ABC transporter permease subunit [Verrucomicrobiota bacterium]